MHALAIANGAAGTAIEILGVVIVPLTVPWKYAFAHYVTRPGDRWR